MPVSKSPRKTKRSSGAAAAKARAAKSSRTTKSRSTRKRRPLLHPLHISITAVLLVVAGAIFMLTSLGRSETSEAANCTVDAKLVNSCRPWFSAAVGGYPQVSGGDGNINQFIYFNKRLNNPAVLTNPSAAVTQTYKLDIPHVYHAPGQNLFNSNAQAALDNTSITNTTGNPVLMNWKPGGQSWAATARGDNDSSIRTAANEVKALGSRKIMLALWHEPENDNVNAEGVSITGNCKKPTGTNGSAADYRAMWRRVRQVFDQQGVTNVVWVWNPMGWVGNDRKTGWACIENAMYPGDDLVDWIMWDPYSSDHGDFVGSVEDFYTFLTENNNPGAGRNYLSKAWGLAEFGSNSEPALAAGYWKAAKEAMGTSWSTNRFPRIKLYSVFDTSTNGGTNGGLRVGYNVSGGIDQAEQAAFNEFAKSVLTMQSTSTTPTPTPTPTTDTVPPTVTVTAPQDGSRQSGTITVKGTASDNVKVTAVTLRVDDKWIETDGSAPYEFKLDTRKLKEGKHIITLRAWDSKGNMGESKQVTITVDNNRNASDDTAYTPKTSTFIMDATTPSTPDSPLNVSGTIIVSPTVEGSSIEVWLNDKLLPNNVIETTRLANGTYVVKIAENGQTSFKHVSVNNALPVAVANHVRSNAVAYSITAVALVVITAAWFGRSYVFAIINRR